jgi:hypothetical protein
VTIGAVLDEAWTLFTRFFLRFFAITQFRQREAHAGTGAPVEA